MRVSLTNETVVTKVLNNNIILVRDKASEKILFSKGIGFNKKFGQILDSGLELIGLIKIL